jgi:hypothetical protein
LIALNGTGCTHKARHQPREIKLRIVVDLWRFAKHRKKFWLVPLMVMAVAYGALAVFTKGSVLAPFVYTLF